MKMRFFVTLFLFVILGIGMAPPAYAYTFDGNDIMDDSVFNNFGSMNSAQIDTFLNGFPSSCISAISVFQDIVDTC